MQTSRQPRAALTAIFAILAGSLAASTSAEAAVAFRARTCNITDANSISIARPAGTTNGDILIASVATETGTPDPPAGWTQVPGLNGSLTDGQVHRTFYKVASGEPANYSFTNGGNAIAVNVAAFSGGSLTTPINPGATQAIFGSATSSETLPNANSSYAGSMRVSSTMSDDDASSTSFSGMSSMCSVSTAQSSDVALGAAYEAVNVGTTGNRTVSLNDNGRMVNHTLIINPACTGGPLSLGSPATINFPGIVLSGVNQTVPAIGAFDVTDDTGANAGWSISLTSTTFTNAGRTFDTDAARITGASALANVGTCSAASTRPFLRSALST